MIFQRIFWHKLVQPIDGLNFPKSIFRPKNKTKNTLTNWIFRNQFFRPNKFNPLINLISPVWYICWQVTAMHGDPPGFGCRRVSCMCCVYYACVCCGCAVWVLCMCCVWYMRMCCERGVLVFIFWVFVPVVCECGWVLCISCMCVCAVRAFVCVEHL